MISLRRPRPLKIREEGQGANPIRCARKCHPSQGKCRRKVPQRKCQALQGEPSAQPAPSLLSEGLSSLSGSQRPRTRRQRPSKATSTSPIQPEISRLETLPPKASFGRRDRGISVGPTLLRAHERQGGREASSREGRVPVPGAELLGGVAVGGHGYVDGALGVVSPGRWRRRSGIALYACRAYNRSVESTFDPKKNAANLRKHGVSLAEGDGVLNDPLALTAEDLSAAGEQRFVSIGQAKRGAVIPQVGKTRITIYLDDVVIERFKALSEQTGKGYQTLINEALRSHLQIAEQTLTAEELRKILREELAHFQASEPAKAKR